MPIRRRRPKRCRRGHQTCGQDQPGPWPPTQSLDEEPVHVPWTALERLEPPLGLTLEKSGLRRCWWGERRLSATKAHQEGRVTQGADRQ
jgi:hypothetical protein